MSQKPGTRRDPLTRHLLKVKELAEKSNGSSEMLKEIDRCLELVPAKDDYCDRITTDASPDLEQLGNSTKTHPWEQVYKDGKTKWNVSPRMMSGNTEVQLLKSLISMSKAKRILELGCLTGFGALGMAEALPADGIVITCEFDPYLQTLARKYVDESPNGKKITIIPGPAKDTMLQLGEKGEKFDFIFMDANKDGYQEYYKIIFEKGLLAPNGTIAVDNTLGGGYTYSKELPDPSSSMGKHIAEFNEMVLKDLSVQRVLLPLKDGIMLVRRKEDVEGSV